eukprot:14082611-Ditylum_brightwellii.AAC.1
MVKVVKVLDGKIFEVIAPLKSTFRLILSGPNIKPVCSGVEVIFGYIPPATVTLYKDKDNKENTKKNITIDISIG